MYPRSSTNPSDSSTRPHRVHSKHLTSSNGDYLHITSSRSEPQTCNRAQQHRLHQGGKEQPSLNFSRFRQLARKSSSRYLAKVDPEKRLVIPLLALSLSLNKKQNADRKRKKVAGPVMERSGRKRCMSSAGVSRLCWPGSRARLLSIFLPSSRCW
jgi:hypothetical protein